MLAAGESWLIIPYYDDVLRYQRSSGKLLPLADGEAGHRSASQGL